VTSIESALRRIQVDLTDAGIPYALVGGLAVSARTEPRFTRDADFATAVASDAEAESLIHRLGQQGYTVAATVEQEATGRLATVRLMPPAMPAGPVIDLLFASSGLEPEVAARADDLELLPGLTIKVAQTGHLIALKILSRDDIERPQDSADIRALLRVARPADISQAREGVALIEARGFHRGRNLRAALDDLLGRR
jgi:predicted nucleotidyltransferase